MAEVIDKKQKLLIEYLIADHEVFVHTARIVKANYFDKPLDRVMEFVFDYFESHNGIPKVDTIEAETGVKLKKRELEYDEKSYMLEEVEKFCQESAMFGAIMGSVDKVHEGDFHAVSEAVREALMVRLDNSVGIDIFEDTEHRIENTEAAVDERSIGIKAFDNLINKIRRGEVGIIYGSTGAGKSLMLMNVARLLARQKLDCLIISLELDETLYAKRADTIMTGTEIREHKKNAKIIAEKYDELRKDYGNITVKRMPHMSTASQMRVVIMEYILKYKKAPDAVFVDYQALMGVDGMGMKLVSDKFTADEFKTFALQAIAKEFDLYMFTAGQLNRDAEDVMKINRSHVAGGVSAVNASDWAVAMAATEEMIDNDEFQVVQLKIRNGAKTRKPITLYKCPRSLRINDEPFVGKSPVTERKQKPKQKETDDIGKSNGKSRLAKVLKKLD